MGFFEKKNSFFQKQDFEKNFQKIFEDPLPKILSKINNEYLDTNNSKKT